jgi:hypothetical protein
MINRAEDRLRNTLGRRPLPPAPAALHDRLREIAAAAPVRPAAVRLAGSITGPRLVLGIAAVLAGTLAIALFGPGRDRRTAEVPAPSPPSNVAEIDGLPVMTVSQALAAHEAGDLPGGRVAMRGYWTSSPVAHGCAPPPAGAGELEIWCYDDEFGITERDEPIWQIDTRTGEETYTAQGPHLTPYLPAGLDGADQLFLPMINGQWYPPVPIVVLGHFDDPRAEDCRPEARRLCRNRLVIDRIVEFDIDAVPTPGITPSPTPFPSPGPPGMFEPEECAGDVPYTFVGWTTVDELGLDRGIVGHIWAVISRDPVDRSGEWIDGPSGQRYRHFARAICFRAEYDPFETMNYESVPGTEEIHWEDGLITPGNAPVRRTETN